MMKLMVSLSCNKTLNCISRNEVPDASMDAGSGIAIKKNRVLAVLATIYMLFLLFFSADALATTDNTASGAKAANDVMREFNQDDRSAKSVIVQIPDQRKRLIMFIMGIPLLIFITTTVVLGVAMVVYGKKVFIPHMIFAGLSLTLALGHAVVGLVWFNPF